MFKLIMIIQNKITQKFSTTKWYSTRLPVNSIRNFIQFTSASWELLRPIHFTLNFIKHLHTIIILHTMWFAVNRVDVKIMEIVGNNFTS